MRNLTVDGSSFRITNGYTYTTIHDVADGKGGVKNPQYKNSFYISIENDSAVQSVICATNGNLTSNTVTVQDLEDLLAPDFTVESLNDERISQDNSNSGESAVQGTYSDTYGGSEQSGSAGSAL